MFVANVCIHAMQYKKQNYAVISEEVIIDTRPIARIF